MKDRDIEFKSVGKERISGQDYESDTEGSVLLLFRKTGK